MNKNIPVKKICTVGPDIQVRRYSYCYVHAYMYRYIHTYIHDYTLYIFHSPSVLFLTHGYNSLNAKHGQQEYSECVNANCVHGNNIR